jgi:hypothetical protein
MISQIQNNKADLSYMVCKSKEGGSSINSNSTSINMIPDISEIRLSISASFIYYLLMHH